MEEKNQTNWHLRYSKMNALLGYFQSLQHAIIYEGI
jgi:hypothetical protein